MVQILHVFVILPGFIKQNDISQRRDWTSPLEPPLPTTHYWQTDVMFKQRMLNQIFFAEILKGARLVCWSSWALRSLNILEIISDPKSQRFWSVGSKSSEFSWESGINHIPNPISLTIQANVMQALALINRLKHTVLGVLWACLKVHVGTNSWINIDKKLYWPLQWTLAFVGVT